MGHAHNLATGGHPLSRHVEIIAHRGANREAPENTIPAFRRALEMGVDGIELDVHVTRDGIPVVHHDPVLKSGSAIAALTAQEIRAAGDVPTLGDVLELASGRSRVYVEVKAAAAVDGVVDLLRERQDWCAVHSFDHRIPFRAKMLETKLETGILLVSYLVDVVGAMRAAKAGDVWQQADFIDAELVARVHGAAGRVIAWTVNDVTHARTLAALGVDGICTDTPAAISAGLVETTGQWTEANGSFTALVERMNPDLSGGTDAADRPWADLPPRALGDYVGV